MPIEGNPDTLAGTGSGSIDDDVKLLEQLDESSGDSGDDKAPPKPPAAKTKAAPTPEQEVEEALDEVEDEDRTDIEEEVEEEIKAGEEELDDEPAIGRPSIKKIVEAYPDFNKKFPEIREVLFSEREYRKVFPTVESAREANDKAETFDQFDNDISQGDPSTLIGALNPQSLNRIAQNFLPALFQKDQKAYLAAIDPVIKGVLRRTARIALQGNNQNLQNAIDHVSAALYDGDDKAYLKDNKPRVDPELQQQRQELDTEKRNIFMQKRSEFLGSVNETTATILGRDLEKTLDPNNAFTPAVRRALVKEIIEEVDQKLTNDPTHMKHIERLKNEAGRTGFTREYRSRVITAYLGAFRALVGPVRQRIRNEALGKLPDNKERVTPRKYVPERGSNSSTSSRTAKTVNNIKGLDPKKINWKETSDMDILDGKATLR